MSAKVSRRGFQGACLVQVLASMSHRLARAQDDRGRPPSGPAEPRVLEELRRLLPLVKQDDLLWLAAEYGNTAINIARDHGRQGADVLLALGPQGLAVLREQPDTFLRVSSRLGGRTAAYFLVAMHRHFEELAEPGGLPRMLDRFEALPKGARALGERHPQMLPFLILAPDEAYAALSLHPDLCLLCFPSLDLSGGPGSLIKVARLITDYGERSRPWVRARGLDGLLLLPSFAVFLDRIPPLDLPVFLTVLSNNQADLAPLMDRGEAERVWDEFLELVRWDSDLPGGLGREESPVRGDLVRLACTEPHALWFLVERGAEGRRLVEATWPESVQSGVTLPGLLAGGYAGGTRHPRLLEHAWQSFVRMPGRERETFQMLLLMAQWGGTDIRTTHPRSERFRRLLGRLGHRVVAYLAEAERDEGSAGDRYARLEDRGRDELDAWECPPSFWVQQLPFYDVAHLGWLVSMGYTPTQGEVIFAGIDVAFSVWDLASLGGGKAATATARNGIKTADKALTRRALEEVAERVTPRALRAGPGSWTQRGLTGLAGQLGNASAVVRELSRKSLYSDVGVAVSQAGRSASRMEIKLMTATVGKYFTKEWARNMAIGATLPVLASQAARMDNALYAAKAREALLWMNRSLDRPISAPQVGR